MKSIHKILTIASLFIITKGLAQPTPVTKTPIATTKQVIQKPIGFTGPSYDATKITICIDTTKPGANLPPRISSAGPSIPRINADGSIATTATSTQGLTGASEKFWNVGQHIKVHLSPTNSTPEIRQKVMQFASEWSQFGNVFFDFVADRSLAQIKVGFVPDGLFWSWIGRDVMFNPLQLNTMNLGFNRAMSDREIKGLVLHEFGHSLGLLHEHQSPIAGIDWDKPKVYDYFFKVMGWPSIAVDWNVFKKYTTNNTNYSRYDTKSIMHYFFPSELIKNLNGLNLTENYELSSIDKEYIGSWYPYPPKGVTTGGNLITGDDCDNVDFYVEYNVVDPAKVEFVLSLGSQGSKRVTWWKQVVIPMKGGKGYELWVQNHSLIQAENIASRSVQFNVNDLDKTRGIDFWKAKLLGVHTPLNYSWKVMPALVGGCRVTLRWNRDTCAP